MNEEKLPCLLLTGSFQCLEQERLRALSMDLLVTNPVPSGGHPGKHEAMVQAVFHGIREAEVLNQFGNHVGPDVTAHDVTLAQT